MMTGHVAFTPNGDRSALEDIRFAVHNFVRGASSSGGNASLVGADQGAASTPGPTGQGVNGTFQDLALSAASWYASNGSLANGSLANGSLVSGSFVSGSFVNGSFVNTTTTTVQPSAQKHNSSSSTSSRVSSNATSAATTAASTTAGTLLPRHINGSFHVVGFVQLLHPMVAGGNFTRCGHRSNAGPQSSIPALSAENECRRKMVFNTPDSAMPVLNATCPPGHKASTGSTNVDGNRRSVGASGQNQAWGALPLCELCAEGKVEIDNKCDDCPEGASCGDAKNPPEARHGYWQSEISSTTFYSCPQSVCCVSASCSFNDTMRCGQHREGLSNVSHSSLLCHARALRLCFAREALASFAWCAWSCAWNVWKYQGAHMVPSQAFSAALV